MEMETRTKIIYNKNVEKYLDELAYELFTKEFFGVLKTAKDYVDTLIFEIERSISIKQHKIASSSLFDILQTTMFRRIILEV